jgi:hypothetical protein
MALPASVGLRQLQGKFVSGQELMMAKGGLLAAGHASSRRSPTVLRWDGVLAALE